MALPVVFGPDISPDLGDLDLCLATLDGRIAAIGTPIDWVPTLSFERATVGEFTYRTQTGRYFKIGRQVTAEFEVAWGGKPSGGLVLRMNLPVFAAYTIVRGYISRWAGVTLVDNMGIGGTNLGVYAYSNSLCTFYVNGSNTESIDPRIHVDKLANGGGFVGVLNYTVF